MEINTQNGYIAPEVKFVEVITEEGFAISGIIINERYQQKYYAYSSAYYSIYKDITSFKNRQI